MQPMWAPKPEPSPEKESSTDLQEYLQDACEALTVVTAGHQIVTVDENVWHTASKLNNRRIEVFSDGTVVFHPGAKRKFHVPDVPGIPERTILPIVLGPAGHACKCCSGSGREKD